MALRARMHPRNIYKTPPNFKELAIRYPEFRKYVIQELSGRITLNYNDRKSVMELTKVLLLRDFNLQVEIHEDRLIPRVPVCLNYILWVEDLLTVLSKEGIKGIDIGTGSACIYSLLASTKGWNMLATEIDRVSFEMASKNVIKNKLHEKITVKFVEDSDKILEGVIENESYDFCMCNPPFFGDHEKPQNRTRKRKMIEVAASYVNTDIITSGGEIEFIKKLISESQNLRDKVKIYTTLVGKKSDFVHLKNEITKINPGSFTYTEFCQGNTIRWGIAWSFLKLNFSDISNSDSVKQKKSKTKFLQYFLPDVECKLVETSEKLQGMLIDLKISYTKECIPQGYMFTLKAVENTWSHQRRKKRLKKKEQEQSTSGTEVTENAQCSEGNPQNMDSPCNKKVRFSENIGEKCDHSTSGQVVSVECLLSLKESAEGLFIEMSWLSGDKECVHQIFQFLKNNWANNSKICNSEKQQLQ